MQEKLTEKLESFSNLLDSLNNGKRKKLVMNLRSISKLNRLKQMMKNISFLADKNHINDTQSLSLTSRDEIERRIKRIKNEKNESLEITKESMRSAMVKITTFFPNSSTLKISGQKFFLKEKYFLIIFGK